MSALESALQKEAQGLIVEAIAEYEQVINSDDTVPLDIYINLAFAYWQCTDFGFATVHDLDESLQRKAFGRAMNVLDKAEKAHPGSPETRFWRLYFRFVSLGSNELDASIGDIVSAPNCNAIPFFYLSMTRKTVDPAKTAELLATCAQMPTFKNRYIQTVLGLPGSRRRSRAHVPAPTGHPVKSRSQ